MQLNVSADIQVALGLKSPVLNLGDVVPGQSFTRSIELVGEHAGNTKITGATVRDQLTVALLPQEKGGAATSVPLRISVAQNIPTERPFHVMVELQTLPQELGPLRLRVSGYATGEITARPHRIDLQPAVAGEPVNLRFDLQTTSGRKFNVLEVKDQMDRFTGKLETVAAGTHFRVVATLPGELTVHPLNGVAVVKTDSKEQPVINVPYRVVAAHTSPTQPARMPH